MKNFVLNCIYSVAACCAILCVVPSIGALQAQTPINAIDGHPLFADVQHPHSALEIDHGSLTLISGGCVRTDSSLRFTVVGSSQQGDSLIGLELYGSLNFQLLTVPLIPSAVGLLDSIAVGYTSQGLTADTGWLRLRFRLNGAAYDTSIILIGQNPGPAVEALPVLGIHTGAAASNITKSHVDVNAGDLVSVGVHLDRDVTLNGRLDSIEVSYIYDDDAVTVAGITPMTGWSVATEQSFGGVARFRLIPDPSLFLQPMAAVHAGDLLAELHLTTSLSRTTSTSIVLDQFTYYLDSASSHGCLAQAIRSADSVSIGLNQQCGNGQLTDMMKSFSALNILSLYPNPVGTPNQVIQVTFDLNTNTHVTVSVTDANGKEVSKVFDNDLTIGEHSVGLNSSTIPDGVYFVVVVVDGQRVIRKIVVGK